MKITPIAYGFLVMALVSGNAEEGIRTILPNAEFQEPEECDSSITNRDVKGFRD